MLNFLSVALGGALGAVGRYAMSLLPLKSAFPLLTLLTNFAGAVLIGFIVGIASRREDLSKETVLFFKVGICGGFTTFSTFSLEALNLFESKSYFLALTYILLSVIGCILGVIWGKKLSFLAG